MRQGAATWRVARNGGKSVELPVGILPFRQATLITSSLPEVPTWKLCGEVLQSQLPASGHLPHHDNKGDILPLHPALLSQDLEGIDESNLEWVQLIFVILNFHYCAGWTKPVCVPFQPNLSANQKWSIAHIARQVSRTMEPSSRTPSAEEAQSQLASRCFDYSGQPIEFMEDLVAEKVVMAWPKPGKAAVVKLVDCLPHWLREAIESPDDFWVPWDAMPDHTQIQSAS